MFPLAATAFNDANSKRASSDLELKKRILNILFLFYNFKINFF